MMKSDSFNSPPPPPGRRSGGDIAGNSSKRSKLNSVDDYKACGLVALTESGGNASSPATPTANNGASQPSLVNSYRCNLCGKVFPSHQALGGHKASHRSKSSAASNYACGPNPSGGRHQCSTCGRRFETGQALGGHMRKHYSGVIGWNGSSKIGANYSGGPSVVTSSSSDSAAVSYSGDTRSGFTPGPRNFDLNLTPPSSPQLDLTLKL